MPSNHTAWHMHLVYSPTQKNICFKCDLETFYSNTASENDND